jgi:hypothetical protein
MVLKRPPQGKWRIRRRQNGKTLSDDSSRGKVIDLPAHSQDWRG